MYFEWKKNMCKYILHMIIVYDTILCDIKIIKYLFYSVDTYKVLLGYLTFRCIFFFFFFFSCTSRRFTVHKNLSRCREQEGSATFSNSLHCIFWARYQYKLNNLLFQYPVCYLSTWCEACLLQIPYSSLWTPHSCSYSFFLYFLTSILTFWMTKERDETKKKKWNVARCRSQ